MDSVAGSMTRCRKTDGSRRRRGMAMAPAPSSCGWFASGSVQHARGDICSKMKPARRYILQGRTVRRRPLLMKGYDCRREAGSQGMRGRADPPPALWRDWLTPLSASFPGEGPSSQVRGQAFPRAEPEHQWGVEAALQRQVSSWLGQILTHR